MNDSFLLTNVLVPVGSIIAFAGQVGTFTNPLPVSPPTTQPIESFGWMLCDGASLNASQYPELYAVLGNLYGTSGSGRDQKFNLPDLRGQFLRGIGIDDASNETRTAAPGGTKSGVGSKQLDALQIHQHEYTEPTGSPAPGNSGSGTATVIATAVTSKITSIPQEKVSQYETRPTNVFVNYLIKFTYKLPKFNQFPV